MLSNNPFSILAELISPLAMQFFIISMLLNRQNTYMTGAVIAVDGGLSAGL